VSTTELKGVLLALLSLPGDKNPFGVEPVTLQVSTTFRSRSKSFMEASFSAPGNSSASGGAGPPDSERAAMGNPIPLAGELAFSALSASAFVAGFLLEVVSGWSKATDGCRAVAGNPAEEGADSPCDCAGGATSVVLSPDRAAIGSPSALLASVDPCLEVMSGNPGEAAVSVLRAWIGRPAGEDREAIGSPTSLLVSADACLQFTPGSPSEAAEPALRDWIGRPAGEPPLGVDPSVAGAAPKELSADLEETGSSWALLLASVVPSLQVTPGNPSEAAVSAVRAWIGRPGVAGAALEQLSADREEIGSPQTTGLLFPHFELDGEPVPAIEGPAPEVGVGTLPLVVGLFEGT